MCPPHTHTYKAILYFSADTKSEFYNFNSVLTWNSIRFTG